MWHCQCAAALSWGSVKDCFGGAQAAAVHRW
jgi:hypothetical protein